MSGHTTLTQPMCTSLPDRFLCEIQGGKEILLSPTVNKVPVCLMWAILCQLLWQGYLLQQIEFDKQSQTWTSSRARKKARRNRNNRSK
jgi:hypothetical protein